MSDGKGYIRGVDTFLVGFDYSNGKDKGVLIVGKKKPNSRQAVDVINAFQGQEALELYEKLTIKKDNKEKNDEE